MRKFVCLLPFALALVLAPSAVSAQSRNVEGWYVGFSLGKSRLKYSEEYLAVLGTRLGPGPVSTEESAESSKLLLGYRMARHFGLEVDLMHLGSFRVHSGSEWSKVDLWAESVDAVGFAPIGERLGLFGKLAVLHSIRLSRKAGIGAEYVPGRVVGLRIEIEQFHDVKHCSTSSCTPAGDVRTVTLGVTFHL